MIGPAANPTPAQRCELLRREAIDYIAMCDGHLAQPSLNEIQRARLESMRDVWTTVKNICGPADKESRP